MELEEFKKQVKEGTLKDRNYFYKRTEYEKNILIQDMKDLSIFIKKTFNLDVYLIYGTLLGAIREKDFLPHDYDVDFAYMSKQTNITNILHEFYGIAAILKNHDLLVKTCQTGQLHVNLLDKKNIIDLWTSFSINDKFYLIPLFDGNIKSSIILPLKSLTFRSADFLIPNKPDMILDATYFNWKTPLLDKQGVKTAWKHII